MIITIKALGEVKRELGFEEKKIEFQGDTLKDLLLAIITKEGKPAYYFFVEKDKIKDNFIFSINGCINNSLNAPIKPGDQIICLEIFHFFHGG